MRALRLELKWKRKRPEKEKIHEVLPDRDDGTKVTNIRVTLEDEIRSELVAILERNIDCSAWSHLYIEGIDPKVITYRLNVDLSFRQIKQKSRKLGMDRNMKSMRK